nr:hypothetical protein [Tanacetum cinerariifolium]
MANPHKNWLVQKQTALGKDKLNPLMADNLPKIIWYSTHRITLMKSWLVQKQTALGKDKSNPLMADNLPKIIWYSTHRITLMKSWLVQKQTALVQKQTALGKDKSNPLTVDSLLKTIWLSIHHHLTNEVSTIQGRTTTGKEISNLFMTNDVTRLQALVDKKKVVITEATIRDALRLDDAEGVDYLPNEEIFAELARMGYEKPSTKLTFYKAFFSSQWKFLIHTILQSMSAKRTSWNEFSSAMESAIICLSTGAETPLFEGMLVEVFEEEGDADEQIQDNIEDAAAQEADAAAHGADSVVQGDDVHETSIPSPTPPTPPLQQSQDLPSTSQVQHTPPQSALPQSQPQPQAQPQAADFPMSLLHEALDACATLTRRVEHLEYDKVAQALEITKLKRRVKKLEKGNKVKVLKLRRLQKVKDDQVKGKQAEIYQIDMDHASKVLSMQEDEPAEVQEVVDVVTTAKLITEVVTAASESVTATSTTIAAAEPHVHAATITAAPVRVAVASTRRKKRVVIRNPKEESTAIIPADTKSKDKGKGIMVEEPKPLKKKQQVKMDEEYARKLHEELNKDIDGNVAIDHVKQKAKEVPFVQRYQVMKKRPQTKAQARKNIIMYLKNVAGFRLDYFKGMSYDEIRLIFEAKFNSNIAFLLKSKEQLEEEENRAIESINETPTQKAAKRRKLNKEVEDLKRYLEIVPDEDDDVYTEATLLARKVPVVDYEIIHLNNKPHYKINQADGTHQLYVSFLILLKNFDREDLESLWSLVKERFSKSKPNNFFDDFLLTTLRAMFERPYGQAQVWKNQRTVHGQAKVKTWKLLESCGVHIITFTTTQLIFLVERRYPLSRVKELLSKDLTKKVTTVKVNKVNVVQGNKGNAEKASPCRV